MTVDWKSNLLSAVRTPAPRAVLVQAVEQAVDQAIAAGGSIDDVRQFAASQPALSSVVALFADGFFDHREQKAAQLTVGGDSRLGRATLTSPGLKAHAVRADPAGALPWFNRANLPPVPTSTLTGPSGPVLVDGERFDAADVAALLRLAA